MQQGLVAIKKENDENHKSHYYYHFDGNTYLGGMHNRTVLHLVRLLIWKKHSQS